MNSYTFAFGILGSGILVAAILWSLPRLRCRHQIKRFRRELFHVDVVTLAWAQSLPHQEPSDEVPAQSQVPETRRSRRNRRHDPPAPQL